MTYARVMLLVAAASVAARVAAQQPPVEVSPIGGSVGCALDTPVAVAGDTAARKYAPLLKFAPGERYFPILPFFTAYDKNFRTFAPVDADNKPDWRALDDAYRSTIDGGAAAPARAAVFYSHDWLSDAEIKRLWRAVRTDNQAQRRAGIRQIPPRRVELFKYVFYYVNDLGLKGHAHDVEKVLIYVVRPDKEPLTRADSATVDADTLPVIIVGAGHTATNPNNIAVLTGRHALPVRREPGEIGILVELGAHASAPDIGHDGQFDVGVDVNWFLDAFWGTRDALAISGQGFSGRYQTWMTMRRELDRAVTLVPTKAGSADAAHAFSELYTQATRTGGGISRDTASAMVSTYALLPMRYFHALDSAVENYRSTKADSSRRRAAAVLHDCITPAVITQWKNATPPDTLTAEHMNQLAAWHTNGKHWIRKDIDARPGNPLPWHDGEYLGDGDGLFKAYLQRPAHWKAYDRLAFNYSLTLLGSYSFRLGLQFGGPDWIIHVPGMLEFQAGIQQGVRTRSWSAAAIYDRQYRQTFSWFMKLDAVDRRDAVERRDANPFAFVAGLSAMLDDIGPWGLARRMRIRIGPSVEIGHNRLSAEDIRWDLSVGLRRR